MKIVLATNNKHKIREMKDIWSALTVEILTLEDFPGFPIAEETGKTLEENAILKAKVIYKFTQLPSVADDSGLEHINVAGPVIFLPGTTSVLLDLNFTHAVTNTNWYGLRPQACRHTRLD